MLVYEATLFPLLTHKIICEVSRIYRFKVTYYVERQMPGDQIEIWLIPVKIVAILMLSYYGIRLLF